MQKVTKAGSPSEILSQPDTGEEPELQPASPPSGKKVGALYRTIHGYFGFLPLRVTRVTQINSDGSKLHSRAIKIPIRRLGIERSTKEAVGIMDTRVLPESVTMGCEELWGENWRPKFDKEVKKLAPTYGLEEITSETVIDLESKHTGGPEIILDARTVASLNREKPEKPE